MPSVSFLPHQHFHILIFLYALKRLSHIPLMIKHVTFNQTQVYMTYSYT